MGFLFALWNFISGLLDFVENIAFIEMFIDILESYGDRFSVLTGCAIGLVLRITMEQIGLFGPPTHNRNNLEIVALGACLFRRTSIWLSAVSVGSRLWSNFRLSRRNSSADSSASSSPSSSSSSLASADFTPDSIELLESIGGDIRLISGTSSREHDLVTKNDLEHLLHLLDGKGWDTYWQNLMERSTSNMAYQAWRHEPETGPLLYKSRTVFEDATPELVRDFFWDDEFRPKWDPMLVYFNMLDECPHTGTTIVHWIKKFPFFCSDREYIIGRRIWEAGNTYYCVTKAVPYPALPKRDKPRRVDIYFSSWVIKPVQSRKGDGQLTACEVTLVHHEDMGIPKDVAKLGVRHGMWGTVKKLNGGLRAYQVDRKSEAPLSRSAQVARITTKISVDGTTNSSETESHIEDRHGAMNVHKEGGQGGIDWKWLVLGGAVALACGLHTGVIGKTVAFGAGQRIARRGRVAARR